MTSTEILYQLTDFLKCFPHTCMGEEAKRGGKKKKYRKQKGEKFLYLDDETATYLDKSKT